MKGQIALSLFCVGMSLPAFAQKRSEVLKFDNELIEGSVQTPELMYLLKQKNFNYKKLIKIRKDFLPEMKKTSEILHPSGSGS